MISRFETAAEAASALKFDIDELIDAWFDEHSVDELIQRRALAQAMRKAGFDFFEEELYSYFESNPNYDVTDDGWIVHDDGFGEEEEDWMPID